MADTSISCNVLGG